MQQHSSLARYSTAFMAATVITAGLLWIMQQAIQSDGITLKPAPVGDLLSLVRKLDEPPPEVNPPVIKKPPVPTPPPRAHVRQAVLTSSTGGFGFTAPGVDVTVNPVFHGAADGELLPYMTVAPEYPQRQAARGVEGWVLIEFVVDELGRVREPQIIDHYPNSGFDRAALDAVKRYKYKPRVVNGDAVPVSGVRQRIVFNLT